MIMSEDTAVQHLLKKQRERKGKTTMALTNSQIILQNALQLMEQGILKGSGEMAVQELPDGTKIEIELPEVIHTYNGWKERGYQVRRGQKAKATFTIWRYIGKKVQDEESGELEEVDGKCIPKKSSWFTFDQVEKIA